jgi:hypothetical protein
MFFRIWFLYLCKVFVLGMVLAAVGMAAGGSGELGRLLKTVGCAIVVPLGIAGAFTAVVVLFRKRLACPLCGRQGDFVLYGKSPGIECAHCGLVYCKRPLLSFRLSVEPPATDDPNDAS